MSLTKEEIEKVYRLRDSLKMTYRLSTNRAQKGRIGETLKELEDIIKNIESGKWVNPVKIHLYTKKTSEEPEEAVEEKSSYRDKINFVKLSENNKDLEMDEMFSYLLFFEDTFIVFLKAEELKLEYEFSKRRNDFLLHYSTMRRLIDEYISDTESFTTFTTTEQREHYRDRLMHQKNYILIKLSENLAELKGLLIELLDDASSGRNEALLNADERYYSQINSLKTNIFEGSKNVDIVRQALDFIVEFNTTLRIPNFKKKKE